MRHDGKTKVPSEPVFEPVDTGEESQTRLGPERPDSHPWTDPVGRGRCPGVCDASQDSRTAGNDSCMTGYVAHCPNPIDGFPASRRQAGVFLGPGAYDGGQRPNSQAFP